MKASPGRGKLSPQVTDEGVGEQQLTGKLPLIRRCAPPSPQGVKALGTGFTTLPDRITQENYFMASYRYERDIDPKDLKPRKQRQYSRKERWANWWDYNLKWVLIFGIAQLRFAARLLYGRGGDLRRDRRCHGRGASQRVLSCDR